MADISRGGGVLPYEPPLCLWTMVEQYVPSHEREEVKNILGQSLVEQSLELHEEVKTLLDIWCDYRQETNKTHPQHLPEPPTQRELLKKEIKFFVECIREKSKEKGRDPELVLSRHNSEVLEYICDDSIPTSPITSRPSTARSSLTGRETPIRGRTSTEDRMSPSSTQSAEVEALTDRLNVLNLEDVVQHLRDTLTNEVTQLLDDISFLQACLEDEADFRDQATVRREPTLTELREERTKLEKELLVKEPIVIPDVPSKRSERWKFPASALPNKSSLRPKKDGSLATSAGIIRSTPPGGEVLRPSPPSGKHRPSPMKASHQISTKVLHLPQEATKTTQITTSQFSKFTDDTEHIVVRTPQNPAKLVKVGCVRVPSGDQDVNQNGVPPLVLTPSPPTSARPSSANRFRRMILDCRNET